MDGNGKITALLDEGVSACKSVKMGDGSVEIEEENGSVVAFTGKKKSSTKKKGKSITAFANPNDEGGSEVIDAVELELPQADSK